MGRFDVETSEKLGGSGHSVYDEKTVNGGIPVSRDGILERQFQSRFRVFLDSSFGLVFYPLFTFYTMLFMNRLEFACFAYFFVRIFKTREGTLNSMEQNTRYFCQIYVQEFHLRPGSGLIKAFSTPSPTPLHPLLGLLSQVRPTFLLLNIWNI